MENTPRRQQGQKILRELGKYSLSELKEICYRLGVNHEDLPGDGSRTELKMQFHYLMGRQGRLPELVEFLRLYAREKTKERNKKPRKKRKLKEEDYLKMADKLNASIFIYLSKYISILVLGSSLLGFIIASYSLFSGFSLYQFSVYTAFGFLLIPIVCLLTLKNTGKWIREKARQNKFYDLTVGDRKHSKDRLYNILMSQYKAPLNLILKVIANRLLWARKDGKRD